MSYEFILFIFILFVCSCVYSKFKRYQINKIPGPKSWPLIGNGLHYALPPDKLFTFLRSLYKTYGGINCVYSFNFQAVNVYDPVDIETILSSTRFNGKRKPYNFLTEWLCEGLLISNGVKWHQRRKLLTKAFHFNILKKYMRTFIERSEDFVDRVAEIEGKTIDITPYISETTLNVICETTMGTSYKKEHRHMDKYFKAIHDIGQILAHRTSKIWLHFDFIFIFSNFHKIQKQVVKLLHKFTTSIIMEQKEKHNYEDVIKRTEDSDVYKSNGHLAMLDLLLQNERDGLIDLNGIREEVDTFMFEGHDTTAMAISFFIMRIANEKVTQEKIYEEMQRIFGDSTRSPTVEDINEMKYLECCIKESLRLYPSVPFIARYVHEEIILSGYKVPRNTNCHINIFDLHRCDKLYPNPEEFIPERFLAENSTLRHPYAYIPFSAGPRNCIGQKFAMLEMKILMSTLLRKFQIEPITKVKDLVFIADIVLRTNHPLYVRFSARN